MDNHHKDFLVLLQDLEEEEVAVDIEVNHVEECKDHHLKECMVALQCEVDHEEEVV